MKLAKLYGIDKNGRERLWEINSTGCTTTTTAGLVDGKKVVTTRDHVGKNIGRSNETTPEQQASFDAQKRWVKQLEKGYCPKKKDKKGMKMYRKVMKEKKKTGGHTGNVSAAIGGRKRKKTKLEKADNFVVRDDDGNAFLGPKCMKGHVWELEDEDDKYSVKKKVKKYFNTEERRVWVQWKLDGQRVIVSFLWNGDDVQVALTTSSGKQYPWFGRIKRELECLAKMKPKLFKNLQLDSEVYTQTILNNSGENIADFNIIQGASSVARSSPYEFEDQFKLFIFDTILLDDPEADQVKRLKRFKKIFKLHDSVREEESTLVRVPFIEIDSITEVPDYHDEFAEQGFEGIIIRAEDLVWTAGKRKQQLRKFKYFVDEEFEVVGMTLKEGVTVDNFKWQCAIETDNGTETFDARPMGERGDKIKIYKRYQEDPDAFIGRMVVVKFQEYTHLGIPRFPVVKGFRNDEDI